MLDKWQKKEKPVFTGIARGVGGFGFGAAAGDTGSTTSEDGTQSNPFTSIANAYAVSATNGLHYFQNSGVNSGTAFQLRYASYDNRGWVETFISTDSVISTPWDHFLNYNGGNRPSLTNYNLSNGGLDYSSIGAVVLLGTGFNIVDVAITSKSSKAANGVAATGANQESALPLIASDDLAGTDAAQARQRLADFFEGSATGFSIGGSVGGSPVEDYAAYWSKSGSNPTGPFEIHLGYREGTKTTEEFHLVDGNTSPGSTYSPNIGWRDTTQTYKGASVGSWSSDSSHKAEAYDIDSGNVLSVWLSDSLT